MLFDISVTVKVNKLFKSAVKELNFINVKQFLDNECHNTEN